jgi:hypothetical protein
MLVEVSQAHFISQSLFQFAGENRRLFCCFFQFGGCFGIQFGRTANKF